MRLSRNHYGRAFSLVELVIVIVVIGIIAAIAVPRLSRGAKHAGCEAFQADLAVLRKAIEIYAAEHGGTYPSMQTDAIFVAQLTTYTNDQGDTNPTRTPPFVLGPYVRSIPEMKFGEGAGNGSGESKVGNSPSSSVGWVYDESIGSIHGNAGTAVDHVGILYTDY